MILPVIYGVMVWYMAMRWRRNWRGFLAVFIGVSVLLSIQVVLHGYERTRRPWPLSELGLLFSLLYPYTALVGGVGVYIATLPRAARSHECKRCRYDMSGLAPDGLVCPECGQAWGPGSESGPARVPIPTGPPLERTRV